MIRTRGLFISDGRNLASTTIVLEPFPHFWGMKVLLPRNWVFVPWNFR